MARPYSLDLRERVVAKVVAGETVRAVAKVFGVGVSSVVKWSQRFRATGSAAAGKMGGHRPKVLVGAHRAWLLARMTAGDFTLRGLVGELADRGLKVDYRTVWNFVHGEKLSFKKNSGRQRTGPSRRRAQARAVAKVSGPDRARALGLHR